MRTGSYTITHFRALLIAAGLLGFISHVDGATRLAVVTAGGKTAAADVVVLVESRLSEGGAVDGVEVLDRAEIDRVLAEQKLSLRGSIATGEAVRTGRILKCDLLVVIEQTPDMMKNQNTSESRNGGSSGKSGFAEKGVPSSAGDNRPTTPTAVGTAVTSSSEPSTNLKPLLSLIVFDSATGLRLWDQALPSDSLEESVTAAVSGIQQAIQKHQRSVTVRERIPNTEHAKPLTLVSLLGARNAELPRAFDSLCDSVSSVLERSLVSSQNIGLLERTHLKHLNEEKELIDKAMAARVLSATVLIDLQFEKAGNSVRAKALLSDAKGHKIATVSVDDQEINASSIQVLADRVLSALHASASGEVTSIENGSRLALAAQRVRESDRYFREARLMESFRQPERALRAVESATLLDPRSDRRALLAKLLFEEAMREIGPAFRAARPPVETPSGEGFPELPLAAINNELLWRAISMGRRALDLVLDFPLVVTDQSSIGSATGDRMLQDTDLALVRYMQLLGECRPVSPDEQLVESFRSQQQTALRRQFDLLDGWHTTASRDPAHLVGYTWIVWWRCLHHTPNPLWELMSRDREEFERISARQFHRWWGLVQNHKAEIPLPVQMLVKDLAQRNWPTADSRDAIRPTLEAIAISPQPAFRWNGRLALMRLEWMPSTWTGVKQYTVQHLAAFQRLRREIESEMDSSQTRKDVSARRTGYEVIQSGLKSMEAGKPFVEQADEWLDLCRRMLDRGEIYEPIWHSALSYRSRFGKDLDQQPFLDQLDRAIAMAGTKGAAVHLSSSSKYGDLAGLQRLRVHLIHERPELAPKSVSSGIQFDVRTLLDLPRDNVPNEKIRKTALLCRWVVEGNRLYGAVLKTERGQGKLEAITISLPDGNTSVMGEIALGFVNGGTEKSSMIPSVCLTDDAFLVAHETKGVFAFGRTAAGTASVLPAHADFPSKRIESLASLDGRLFASLEGGYLVEFNRRDPTCRVIASSRRKEQRTALDDRPIFSIECLTADAERHRLLFMAISPLGSKGERIQPEFWEYRIDTDKARRLVEFKTQQYFGWNEPLFGEHILLQGAGWTVDFDVRTDLLIGISNYKKEYASPMPLTVQSDIIPYRPVARMGNAYWSVTDYGRGPGEVQFNGSATFSRVAFDNVSAQNSSSSKLREERIQITVDPMPVKARKELWILEPFADKHLVWSDHYRIWLLTPRQADVESSTRIPKNLAP